MEDQGLHSRDVVEALHGCLDPSILSIFEDSPIGEVCVCVCVDGWACLDMP